MTPVGYSFNANKPGYHSKDRGGKRRIIIFTTLTIALAAILFFWSSGSKKDEGVKKSKEQYVSLAPTPDQFRNSPNSIANKTIAEEKYKLIPDTRSFPKMEAVLDKAKTAYGQEDYRTARKCCYQILDSRKVPDGNALWQKTVKLLGDANTKILFSDYPFPEKKVNYPVQSNDGLRKIAMQHNTSVETVQRSNNMKLTNFNVQLGKTFNIYIGNWEIIISKSRRKLYLFDDKKLFKVYNVGIGKQGRTPTGVFKTGGKRKNPDWYSPEGKIPHGAP